MAVPVGGLRKHPHGRVDQLEDRYLGMVEAPSSNLGTSTSLRSTDGSEVDCAPQTCNAAFQSSLLARHVQQKQFDTGFVVVLPKPIFLISSVVRPLRSPFYRF